MIKIRPIVLFHALNCGWVKDDLFLKYIYANHVINATCILLYLSKAIYIYIYIECINISIQELFLGALLQALISLARDKEAGDSAFAYLSFCYPFYPCIVYPHIGDFTNLAGYPPLKPKISSVVFISLTTTYHWVWIVKSRKIARWCQRWRFHVSLQRKKYF
jgi:hypothetical protein